MSESKMSDELVHQNKNLQLIGRNTFQHKIAQYLQPYERFLLAATCRWMSAIFNISSFDFNFHSKSDLGVLKHAITDKYFNKQKTYRHCSNCVDLSNKTYQNLNEHEKLCIKYVLIFQDKLPEYFPVHCFQNFLDYSLKLTFSSNDAEYADSIINFLHDVIVHQENCIGSLITSIHLDNIGLNSFNHIHLLSNKILIYTHNIRYLYLADNPLVNDLYIEDLFLCIAAHNHHLEMLDLSNTSITNKTCDVIYDFCLSVYKINKGMYSNYSSDNESNYMLTNDKESQTPSHDNFQEIIYMSSEETDGDNDEDTDFSTDDEFDNIVERRMINNDSHYGQMEVEAVTETVQDDDEQRDDEEDQNETETMHTNILADDDEELPSNSVSMKISFTKIWIDLKNNKGITSDGVDKLNQIYVKKIEPSKNFVICVEGCCYEPNPKWDLSLL